MRIAVILMFALALAGPARAESPAKEKVFIPPVRGEGIANDVLSALFDLVVIAVDRAQVMDVVTLDDVQAQLDQEKRKDALGCSSVACAVELGGALGVRYLLTTRVKKLGSDVIFTASLIDTREQKSKNGQGRCKDQASEYDKAVNTSVAEAFGLVKVSLSAPATSVPPAISAADTLGQVWYEQESGRAAPLVSASASEAAISPHPDARRPPNPRRLPRARPRVAPHQERQDRPTDYAARQQP